MSNFTKQAVNPRTGKLESADFLDDYFGRHQYGVRFPSDIGDIPVYPLEGVQLLADEVTTFRYKCYWLKQDKARRLNQFTAVGPYGRLGPDVDTFEEAMDMIFKEHTETLIKKKEHENCNK